MPSLPSVLHQLLSSLFTVLIYTFYSSIVLNKLLLQFIIIFLFVLIIFILLHLLLVFCFNILHLLFLFLPFFIIFILLHLLFFYFFNIPSSCLSFSVYSSSSFYHLAFSVERGCHAYLDQNGPEIKYTG